MLAISDSGAGVWSREKCLERVKDLKAEDEIAFWGKINEWYSKQEITGSAAHILWATACWLKLFVAWEQTRSPW